MAYSSMTDFMHAKVGENWVIARRTSRVVYQYGDDVICLSPAKYAKLRAEFDAQAPSAENAARAMLAALKMANGEFAAGMCVTPRRQKMAATICAAIAQAEAAGIKPAP